VNVAGDISIDDIEMRDQACQLPGENRSKPVEALQTPQVQKMMYSVKMFCAGTCDFNSDMCGWTNAVDDDFDWSMNSGPTSTNNTGPSADRTGNGRSPTLRGNNSFYISAVGGFVRRPFYFMQ